MTDDSDDNASIVIAEAGDRCCYVRAREHSETGTRVVYGQHGFTAAGEIIRRDDDLSEAIRRVGERIQAPAELIVKCVESASLVVRRELIQARRPGRPTAVPGEHAKVKVSVWFTPSQYALLLSAKPDGYPVATWAKKVLMAWVAELEARSGKDIKRAAARYLAARSGKT